MSEKNSLAYYVTEFISSVKSFSVQTPGKFLRFSDQTGFLDMENLKEATTIIIIETKKIKQI